MPTELQVWSFEERLTYKDKEDLLKHFGAVSVQHIPRHGRDKAVLARFRREEDCENALKKLHQQKLLGRRLMAVYKDTSAPPERAQPHQVASEASKEQEPPHDEIIKKRIREFEARLSACAANLGIKYPIPPHLKYLYPPPSANTIANIVQTLAAVPKFYTQVLHLMNKMNLPTPFGNFKKLPAQYKEVLQWIGLPSEKDRVNSDDDQFQKNVEANKEEEVQKNSDSEMSESESELESDNDESLQNKKASRPVKRRRPPSRIMSKRPNFSLLKQTCVSHPRPSAAPVGEAFENIDSKQTKKLELKLRGTLPTDTIGNTIVENLEPGGFGKIEAPKEAKETSVDNPVEWKGESSKYISKEELHNNRINKADWAILPVFKNYHQGEPTTKLYLKNLAKTTTEADLKYIYGSYVFWHNEEEASLFTIRLMKEGRMKGQAFVTFPSVEKASEALNDTNGYIFKDKPMVVAFGKVKPT